MSDHAVMLLLYVVAIVLVNTVLMYMARTRALDRIYKRGFLAGLAAAAYVDDHEETSNG